MLERSGLGVRSQDEAGVREDAKHPHNSREHSYSVEVYERGIARSRPNVCMFLSVGVVVVAPEAE